MQTQERTFTPEEYLSLEETAEFRSEYRNGEIVPMTGGSADHNTIVINWCAFLKFALRGKGYKLFASDLRLWIPLFRQYTYPDVMVVRGEPVFQEKRSDTITNPCLIIEVLSRSTENYDRTTKFKYYRSIPELQEYVLVNQYETQIEHYTKLEDNSWLFREYEVSSESIKLTSIDVEMAIADLYEGVDFSLETEEPTNC